MSSDLDLIASSPPVPLMPLMPPPPDSPQQNILPPPPKPPKQLSHDQYRLRQSFSEELHNDFDAGIDDSIAHQHDDNDDNSNNHENEMNEDNDDNNNMLSDSSDFATQIHIITSGGPQQTQPPQIEDGEQHIHISTNDYNGGESEMKITDWLNQNGIKDPEIIKKFVEDNINVSELEMYAMEDVDALCKSYNIKVPYNIKFKKAVIKLQQAEQQLRQNSHSGHPLQLNQYNSYNSMIGGISPVHSPSQIQRIVVFPEEDDCGKQLDDKLIEIMKCHEQFNQVKNTLKNNGTQCTENIKSVFNTLRNVINEREEQLVQVLKEEMNNKMDEINNQQQLFINYQQNITNAKLEYDQLLLDGNMDRNKRQQMILNLTKNAIDSYGHIMSQKIKRNMWLRLDLDTNIVGEYLLKMGKIG